MKTTPGRLRPFARRPRAAALAALLAPAAALLITAAHFRPAVSRQAAADLAADALPPLNLLGRHAVEAAEYARQIKARYPPAAAEHLEARSRYEEAAARFDSLADLLADSLGGNAGGRDSAGLRGRARLAAGSADSFSDWVDGRLRLMRRGRAPGGTPPGPEEAAEAAAAIAGAFGRRDVRSRARASELAGEVLRFKPWNEIPPVSGPASAPSPLPSPSPPPPPSPPPANP